MIDAPAFIEEEPTRNGIREIISLVGRRKLLIFAPAVVTAAIAWGMVSVTVPRYAATAALTLNVDRLHLVDREVVSRLPLENSTLRSEIDVIRSRSLNDEVVVQLGLAGDPGWRGRLPRGKRRGRISPAGGKTRSTATFPGSRQGSDRNAGGYGCGADRLAGRQSERRQ